MSKFQMTTLVLAIMVVLIIPFTSCTSTSELLPLSNNPTKAEASTSDFEARITELENRVAILEQGLDERVIEYNIIHSALWEMIIDNKLNRIPGDSFPYTNDMRQFPSPSAPLYGYDKNGDGIPDTNYVPFETTVWFYEAGAYIPDLMIQGCDPALVERVGVGTRGKAEALETELHNIQTAVMAMMADSNSGRLDANLTFIEDMDLVTSDGGALVLSNYITGINADGTLKSGCKYDFSIDGTVTQHTSTALIPTPEEYEEELHNIQTAVMAMLADSSSGNITAGYGAPTNDMDTITTDGGIRVLSTYLTGLNPDGTIKSGCSYVVAIDGTVTQIIP
jgi:hypothetical protein